MKVPASDSCTAHLMIARCHAQLGNTDEALEAYQAIIQYPGHDARALRAIATRELTALRA